mgnify:FL=1
MATRKITFDPDAGVPVASNLTIYGGTDFSAKFNVVDVSNVGYGFTVGWSVSSQMIKSAGIGATTIPTATFTTGINTITKSITLNLPKATTGIITEGRYEYNVLVKSGVGTVYNIINGNILVYPVISSAP